MRNNGVIRADMEDRYLVAEKIEDIMPMIEAQAKRNAERGDAPRKHDARL